MKSPSKTSPANREEMIVAVAQLVDNKLTQHHRALHGNAPHMRVTKDTAWIDAHGTDQVDTATLDYFHLPSDWQSERHIGAEIAVDEVFKAQETKTTLDEGFIEKTSDILHSKWLERNAGRATTTQKETYETLPESEKEKDRVFVRAAIEVFKLNQR